MTQFQTDYQLATSDTNLQYQVTAAIYQYATTVYTEAVYTSITSASSGIALPAATINVGTTTGMTTTNAPLMNVGIVISGVLTQVQYKGTTATSITGCFGGTGTLAVGQQVVWPGNHATRAQLATRITLGQQPIPPLILSAVSFASLNDSSQDTDAGNAVAALWNLWAGA